MDARSKERDHDRPRSRSYQRSADLLVKNLQLEWKHALERRVWRRNRPDLYNWKQEPNDAGVGQYQLLYVVIQPRINEWIHRKWIPKQRQWRNLRRPRAQHVCPVPPSPRRNGSLFCKEESFQFYERSELSVKS